MRRFLAALALSVVAYSTGWHVHPESRYSGTLGKELAHLSFFLSLGEFMHSSTGRWPGETDPAWWMVDLMETDDEMYWYFLDAVDTPEYFSVLAGYFETAYGQVTVEHLRDGMGRITGLKLVNLGPNGVRNPGGYDDLELTASGTQSLRAPGLRKDERRAYAIATVLLGTIAIGMVKGTRAELAQLSAILGKTGLLALVFAAAYSVRWGQELPAQHRFGPRWDEIRPSMYLLGCLVTMTTAIGAARVIATDRPKERSA